MAPSSFEYAAVDKIVRTLNVRVFGEKFCICGVGVCLGVTTCKDFRKYLDCHLILVGGGQDIDGDFPYVCSFVRM